jgi:hypothetical protein
LRILFDNNVPVGVRRCLLTHEVHTVVELQWHPQLENGKCRVAVNSFNERFLAGNSWNITTRFYELAAMASNS